MIQRLLLAVPDRCNRALVSFRKEHLGSLEHGFGKISLCFWLDWARVPALGVSYFELLFLAKCRLIVVSRFGPDLKI